MVNDTRCRSTSEVVPGTFKRCIRPHEHLERSCVWIEDLNRSDGAPRVAIWSNDPPKQIIAYVIVPELVEQVDRTARAYGFEIGRGHPLVDMIDPLSEDNPFIHENWKDNMVMTNEGEAKNA